MKIIKTGNWNEPKETEAEGSVLQENKDLNLRPIGKWKERPTVPQEKEQFERPEAEAALAKSGDLETAIAVSKGDIPWSLRVTRGVDPDTAARVSQIASSINMPNGTVSRNLGDAEDMERAQGVIKMLTEKDAENKPKFPKTIAWLQNPERMAQGKDDVDALSRLEQTIRRDRQEGDNAAQKAFRSIQYGLFRASSSLAKVPSLLTNIALIPQNTLALALDKPGLKRVAPEGLTNNVVSDYYNNIAEYVKPVEIEESSLEQIKNLEFADAAENIALQALSNAPQLATMAAAAYFGAAPLLTLSGLGVIESADKSAQLTSENKDPAISTVTSLTSGGFEALFERYTLGMLTGAFKTVSKQVGKESAKIVIAKAAAQITGNATGEGASEAATEIGQNLADYVSGDSKAFVGSFGRALNAFLVGGLTGANIATASTVMNSVAREAQYKRDSKNFEEVEEIAAESKLKERNPKAFEGFLNDNMKDKGINKKVFYPSESFAQLFQDDPKQMAEVVKELGIEEQLKASEKTGTDLVIDKAKWATILSGTPIGEKMRGDLRFSIDGMSENEQVVLKSELKAVLAEDKAEFDRLTAEQETPSQIKGVRKQLIKQFDLRAEEADANVDILLAGADRKSVV